MPMCIVHSLYKVLAVNYNYLYCLCLCLELTNSASLRILCSQSPLGLLDLSYTAHIP